MSHEDASELLGAFALDAVEEDEHAELEEHLATCPRCQAELHSLREVAAFMGNSVEPLPEGLWSSIASNLPPRHDEEPPPMPQLVLEPRQPPEQPKRHGATRVAMATLGAIAVAAAAVAIVLGVDLAVRSDNQVSNLQATMSAHPPQSIAQALKTPGHRVVNLETAFHLQVAEFVLVPDGRGFLVASRLPTLPGSHTYQLWAIVGSRPISLGLLGQSPGPASFTMSGASFASQIAITEEPTGGSVVPTLPIIASASV